MGSFSIFARFEIFQVHAEGVAQPLSLNVMRADYMLHKLPGSVDMTASEPGSDPSNAVKAHRTKKAKVEKLPDTFLKQVRFNQ